MHFTVKIKPVNNHGPILNVSPSKIPVDEGAAVVITDTIISIRRRFQNDGDISYSLSPSNQHHFENL